MIVLAMDTSGPCAEVALRDGERLGMTALRGAAHHSQTLIPTLDHLLATLGIAMADIDLVACTTGPGSFTGLRIGMSTVLGLAEALGKPAIGVTTLEATAYPYLNGEIPVAACLDAKREQIYVQTFSVVAGMPQAMDEPRACTPREFASSLKTRTLVVGDGAECYRDALAEQSSGLAVPTAPGLCYHRVQAVAIIAERRMLAGENMAPLLPLYLRPWDGAAATQAL